MPGPTLYRALLNGSFIFCVISVRKGKLFGDKMTEKNPAPKMPSEEIANVVRKLNEALRARI
jgi:hypothetical protein